MATTVTQVFKNRESIGAFTQVSQGNYQLAVSIITVGALQYTTDALKLLDLSTNGLGGLDSGVLAGDSTYNVFVVVDSGDIHLVASLGSAPTGYSSYIDLDIEIKTDYKSYNFIRQDVDSATVENNLINGGLQNWQRGTSSTSMTTGVYLADKFRVSGIAPTTGSMIQDSEVPPIFSGDINKVGYSMKITSTGTGAPAAGDLFGITHGIEQQMFTLKGKKAVYSFWAKANHNATYSMICGNWGVNSYREIWKFNVTTEWKEYNFILDIPDNINYQGGNVDAALFTLIELAPGSSNIAAEGRYVGDDNDFDAGLRGAIGQDNLFDTNGNEFKFSASSLYEFKGDFVDFKTKGKSYQEELQLCQRYYENCKIRYLYMISPSYSTTRRRGIVDYKVTKRVSPSVNISAGSDSGGAVSAGSAVDAVELISTNTPSYIYADISVDADF
jgi:hypothetical protein